MTLIPLSKWCGINRDNGILYQSFSSHQFIVGCIVNNIDDTSFSGTTLRAPGEVSCIQSKSSVLLITSSCTNLVKIKIYLFITVQTIKYNVIFLRFKSASCGITCQSEQSEQVRKSSSFNLMNKFKKSTVIISKYFVNCNNANGLVNFNFIFMILILILGYYFRIYLLRETNSNLLYESSAVRAQYLQLDVLTQISSSYEWASSFHLQLSAYANDPEKYL